MDLDNLPKNLSFGFFSSEIQSDFVSDGEIFFEENSQSAIPKKKIASDEIKAPEDQEKKNKIQAKRPAQLWSACLGNLFEHYDTALFGFLSPFLAPLIFPHHDPMTALIFTYAMIPLGMLARPLGSLVFGYIGDVYGREQALFITLSGMSLVSFAIAFSPTYEQAGLLSPFIFYLGRILQNFLASGEVMGGAIFILENSSEKRHDLLSSLFSASTIAGILLASAGVFCLSLLGVVDTMWRVLYLFGFVTTLFGCLIRRGSTSEFRSQTASDSRYFLPEETALEEEIRGSLKSQPLKQANDASRQRNFPHEVISSGNNSENHWQTTPPEFLKVLWTYRKPFAIIAIGAGFSYASYSVAFVLLNGFFPLVSPLTKAQMMSINTPLLILDFLALPFFGWLASKFSREKVMLAASLGVVILSLPLSLFMSEITLWKVIFLRTAFVLLGVAFAAPFHAFAQQLIPSKHRYLLISLSYSLGSQILGGPATVIGLYFFKQTGIYSSVIWYFLTLSILASFALASAIKDKTLNLIRS